MNIFEQPKFSSKKRLNLHNFNDRTNKKEEITEKRLAIKNDYKPIIINEKLLDAPCGAYNLNHNENLYPTVNEKALYVPLISWSLRILRTPML